MVSALLLTDCGLSFVTVEITATFMLVDFLVLRPIWCDFNVGRQHAARVPFGCISPEDTCFSPFSVDLVAFMLL